MNGRKIKGSFAVGIFVLFLSHFLSAQLPKSRVFAADLMSIPSKVSISAATCISTFNPAGYNNQPRLFDTKIVYMTVGMDTNTITDIFAFDLSTSQFRAITATEDISEFSATPSPDWHHFSTVRIEQDKKTQSLWRYPMNMSNKGIRLLPDLSNIGYHCWMGKDSVALFLVGTVNTLAIANIKTGQVSIIAENVGRCLRSHKADILTFVQKSASNGNALSQYYTSTKITRTIATMPDKGEDFEMLADGSIISGDGSKLVLLDKPNNFWAEVANFSNQGITNINRIHVLGDKIVFVNTEP